VRASESRYSQYRNTTMFVAFFLNESLSYAGSAMIIWSTPRNSLCCRTESQLYVFDRVYGPVAVHKPIRFVGSVYSSARIQPNRFCLYPRSFRPDPPWRVPSFALPRLLSAAHTRCPLAARQADDPRGGMGAPPARGERIKEVRSSLHIPPISFGMNHNWESL
jgi:hypothetical protein